MKTVQIQRFRKSSEFHDRDEHKHASEKFCGPCFMNSTLLFITTQWATTLMLIALLVAFGYWLAART